jgi:hypothetical protein
MEIAGLWDSQPTIEARARILDLARERSWRMWDMVPALEVADELFEGRTGA